MSTDDEPASESSAHTNGQADESASWWIRFRDLLNEQTDWPTLYTFKFITPRDGLDDVKDLFDDHPVKVRSSSRGNYVSVTARLKMHSSDEVLAVYRAAHEIDDVIAL